MNPKFSIGERVRVFHMHKRPFILIPETNIRDRMFCEAGMILHGVNLADFILLADSYYYLVDGYDHWIDEDYIHRLDGDNHILVKEKEDAVPA